MESPRPTDVPCHVCGKEIEWNLLEECAKPIKGATAETVRSAVLYGLVEVRHPACIPVGAA